MAELYDERGLNPHPGQWAWWESNARFSIALAGTQGGKTSFFPWLIAREIKNWHNEGDFLAVTASYDLFRLKFLPAMREVFEGILGIGRYWASSRVIELMHPQRGFLAKHADDPMHGRIILRSASSPGGLESATAKAAFLDEAGQADFTLAVWEAILRRLSLSRGRVWIGTTIYEVTGWLRNLYSRWQNGDNDVAIIQFPSTLNPAFPLEEMERARREMQSWRFSMFYEGQYTKIPSMIYGDYDPQTHDCEPFEIPLDWPRVVGVDPSGGHCASISLAFDKSVDLWYAYREYLELGKSTREHVEFHRQQEEGKWKVVEFVGGGPSEDQERRDWLDNGLLLLKPPIVEIEPGIDRGVSLFRERRICLFRNLSGFKKDLQNYRREINQDGEVTDKIVNKDQFHYCDAFRAAASLISQPAMDEATDKALREYLA